MSKPKKSAAQWLSDTFKNSIKSISEALSTEQYNQFVQDAEALQPEDSEGAGDGDDEGEQKQEEKKGSEEVKNEVPAGSGQQNTDLQNQVATLTTQLNTANQALAAEKLAHEGTIAKLTESQNALSASQLKYKQLRQAVNPMADEDLSNKETNENSSADLTRADMEAREEFKKNRSEA